MKDVVQVHSKEPLNFLLCGKMPSINTNKRCEKVTSRSCKIGPVFDTSQFADPVVYNKKESFDNEKKKIMNRKKLKTPEYAEIKKKSPEIEHISRNLHTYQDNHKRKILQIHQDWEEHYVAQLDKKIHDRLSGEHYKEYRDSKRISITSLGNRPCYNTLSLDEPANIPFISVSTAGLKDHIHRYKELANKEDQLAKIINRTSKEDNQIDVLPEIHTINYRQLSVLEETRFYFPKLSKQKGRRPYTAILKSSVSNELNAFN